MANAKKCDRCLAYYQEVDQNAMDELIHTFSSLLTPTSVEKQISVIEQFLDLCPSCSRSLRKWAGVKEGAEDGN